MEHSPSISLVDNTVPPQQPTSGESSRPASVSGRQGSLSKHLSRASVSGQLAKRKYAKWQPDRLGIPADSDSPASRESSRVRGSISAASSGGASAVPSLQQDQGTESTRVDTADFAPSRIQSNTNDTVQSSGATQQAAGADGGTRSLSELDILYENQRGSFFFGIPLYSHSSLLNFDPGAWMTQDRRDSPVNITNAQVPDPSWEWAWRTWYVDMSGDVDEQGWQYAFSFGSSQWHGTHPWFHSFVRRRRWVRLRTKSPEKRHRGRSDFENAHMLNEDYFTIHSSKVRSRDQSAAGLSRVESGFLNRMSTNLNEEVHLEEIGDIPSLMHALKLASIDRERIDALKKFVQEGGEELYYLNDKIPEIMSMFLFQASRWQFVEYLIGVIHQLSKPVENQDDRDTERIKRKKDNITRAAESARHHTTGPDIWTNPQGESEADLLDLTPISQRDTLLSKRAKTSDEPLSRVGRFFVERPATAYLSCADNFRDNDRLCVHHNLSPLHASDATSASSHMFSRGRPCLRRRLSAVLDTVAAGPDEPLLFLYPRWAAPALQRRQPISSLTPAAIPSKAHQPPGCCACSVLSSSASPFPRRRSGRWISSNAYAKSYNDLGRDLHFAGAGDIGQFLRENDSHGVDQLGRETKNSNTTSPNRSLDFPNVEDGHSGTGERLPRRKQDRRQRRIEGQRRALEMAQQELEHNTSQKLGRQATLQSKLSIRDRKKLRYKEFIHASEMAQLHLRPPGTWKGVRDSLHRMQQNHRVEIRKGAQQKELYIPEETVALLAGMTRTAMKENIWFAPVRNGCWVHVLDPKEGDGARRKVLLSGSSHVMELVEDHINRLREDQANGDSLIAIRKPPIPIFTSVEAMRRKNIPVPVIRAVWHSPREKAPIKLDDFLASHTTPGTVKEFNEYIEDLICTQGLSPYEKSIGRSTVPYTQRISQHLLELFQQDSNHKLFSTAALNRALEFLCKHELLNVARFVFLRAEHVATTDTYNIFLQSAARRQDVRAFRHFMSMMSRAHLCPNSETWLALLNAMLTPRDKTDLITHMMENGYMTETSTIRTAHQLTIQDSLRVHLGNGESVDTFISLMINTHGADWFSPSLISQMFSATASMKDFEATEQLLTICKQHRFTIDSSSLNQILPMCRANVFSAINFALACMNHPSFPGFSPQTWEVLFLMAFKKRHYNICRVVWRYACMNKAVTYNMRQAVWSSLVCAEPLDESIRAQDSAWRFNAGKFIVGLDSHLKNHKVSDSVTQSLPAEFHDDPLLYLVSVPVSQSESTDRKLRTRLSRHLIDRDITLGDIRYEPGHPLGIMLESAAILDRSWKTKPHSLRWMLRKGLMVKVKTKKRE